MAKELVDTAIAICTALSVLVALFGIFLQIGALRNQICAQSFLEFTRQYTTIAPFISNYISRYRNIDSMSEAEASLFFGHANDYFSLLSK